MHDAPAARVGWPCPGAAPADSAERTHARERVPAARAALLALLGLGAPVAAQQPQAPITEDVPPPMLPPLPDSRVYFTTLNVVRYNPLGLESQNRLVYQKRLFDSPSLLLRDTYASAGASLRLSPAFFKLGPVVELQPLAIFNVRAGYEYVQFSRTRTPSSPTTTTCAARPTTPPTAPPDTTSSWSPCSRRR